MTLFKKALGAFVELEPDAPKKEAPVTRTPVAAPPPPSQEVSDKFQKHFQDLFDAANLPGPDYYEFDKAIDALEEQIPDEKVRMKSAFIALMVQGLTKEKLIDSAKQYITVIEQDRAQFEREVASKVKERIDPLRSEVSRCEQEVAEDEKRIKELQEGLVAKNKAIADAKAKLAEAEEKLGANGVGYTAACEAMTAHINQDIDIITKTL